MRARRDLFGTDHGLVLRMVTVGLLTPFVVLGALVLVMLLLTSFTIRAVIFGALCVGVWVAIRERVEASSRGRRLTPAEAPDLHAILERLCVVADLPKPTIVLDSRSMPNSWIEGTRRGGFRLHLTQGLLDLLEPRELEAVIAHELAHVVNRDAAVMTVVGGPGEALLAGGVRVASQGWFPVMVGGAIASAIGWIGTFGTRALSRYREFAADEGAVALTGSPAALASALMKVSDGLVAMPRRDLREAALHDAFHLLPASKDTAFGLPATHPPLEARIARLERLERALHRH
ncbi:M48 family metalloprotease [Solirubrobacter soli]|uniref:M48 family metalloprotease n=1 Tax=Solirubrobacter soli TaxID=363832 RepID=UPI000420DDBD|nr:M48 family metalloprotease [Solirubrobacter soli]